LLMVPPLLAIALKTQKIDAVIEDKEDVFA